MKAINGCSMLARRTDKLMRQRGVALITILLVVAVLTAIVSRLSLSSEVWLRQVENSTSLAQAEQATRGAQLWINLILEQDSNDFDGTTDIWAQPLPPIPVAWGELYAWIEDMQARINLNNLIDEEGKLDAVALLQLERLLEVLDLDPRVAQAIVDWIDPDSDTAGPWGAEDIFYIGLDTPYSAANRPLADTGELRMVRGIDQQTWDTLEPYIAALPGGTIVNVNMASPEVLAAMMTDRGGPRQVMTEAERWTIEATRLPYTSAEDFAERALGNKDSEMPRGLTIDTEFFLAHTLLTFGDVEYRMATLYHRNRGNASIINHTRELF